MIGSPDINQEIVSALELVTMVGDIGREVRAFAVLFADDPIFFIPELRGPEPQGAFILE